MKSSCTIFTFKMDVTILFCYIKSGSWLCAWDENQNIQSFFFTASFFQEINLLLFNWARNSCLTIPDGVVNACILWMELKHVSVEGVCPSQRRNFLVVWGDHSPQNGVISKDVSARGWEYTKSFTFRQGDDIWNYMPPMFIEKYGRCK